MRIFISSLLILFSISTVSSQCNGDSNKVIVIGDSWAFFSWTYDSYNENLDKFGLTDMRAYSDTGLSINGTQADNFFNQPSRKINLINALNNYPEASIVHMSLGGNDFLGDWNKNMTQAQVDTILLGIVSHLKRNVDTIRSISPDLTVYITGYDFPNFVETAGVVGSSHPFHGLWTDMGQPDALEINTQLLRMNQFFMDSIDTWDNVYMVNNAGLMQWHYGQDNPLLIFPFSTYSANSVPLPGGNPSFPSPLDAMGVGGVDSFHLRDGAYEVFVERMMRLFHWRKLRNADVSIYADNTKSGTIYNDASIATTEVKLGNTTGLDARGILSFNTAVLDESKSIAKASVFVKRKTLSGANPIGANLLVGIINDSYGASDLLDGDEFNAVSSDEAISCAYGTISQNNYWMRIDLPQVLLQHINPLGITQLKLEYLFADIDRNIDFYNVTDTNSQIVLDIVYGGPVGILENGLLGNKMTIFPNPVKDVLTVSFNEVKTGIITIYNLLGSEIIRKEMNESNNAILSLEHLPKGSYCISFSEANHPLMNKMVIIE